MVGLQLHPTVPGFMLAALFCLFVLFVCFWQSLNIFSKIDSNYLAQPDFLTSNVWWLSCSGPSTGWEFQECTSTPSFIFILFRNCLMSAAVWQEPLASVCVVALTQSIFQGQSQGPVLFWCSSKVLRMSICENLQIRITTFSLQSCYRCSVALPNDAHLTFQTQWVISGPVNSGL